MYLIKRSQAPAQAHVGIPEGLHEKKHGRRGFSGPSSHLYRRHPPTRRVRIDGPLRPRAFACAALPTPDLQGADAPPLEILRSPDVRVFVSRRERPMPYFVRNADGDEVHFVHAGRGRYETDYGLLAYEPGDYVVIPKGTTYRIVVEAAPSFFLIAETPEPVELPDRGLLGRHALFDRGVLTAPELPAEDTPPPPGEEWECHAPRLSRHFVWG